MHFRLHWLYNSDEETCQYKADTMSIEYGRYKPEVDMTWCGVITPWSQVMVII